MKITAKRIKKRWIAGGIVIVAAVRWKTGKTDEKTGQHAALFGA